MGYHQEWLVAFGKKVLESSRVSNYVAHEEVKGLDGSVLACWEGQHLFLCAEMASGMRD